ncbi:MAG: outer membrane protein assembly factor BamD [Luteibaculaceae bacterium]
MKNILGRFALLLFTAVLLFLMPACTDYSKVLKSTDINYKYDRAVQYFEAEEWYKAQTLVEELISLLRGSDKSENLYYMLAMSHYKLKEYYLASYYFKSFSKTFATSERAEEAAFLAAYCSYMVSGPTSLDQQETYEAIDEFQLFLNRYPKTDLRDSCNKIVDRLRAKLETKSFENAVQYYRTRHYQAAVVALDNLLKENPNSPYKEQVLLYIVKSNYEYALNSVESKKLDRLKKTIKSYHKFVDDFPNSSRIKEAEQIFEVCSREIRKISGEDISDRKVSKKENNSQALKN